MKKILMLPLFLFIAQLSYGQQKEVGLNHLDQIDSASAILPKNYCGMTDEKVNLNGILYSVAKCLPGDQIFIFNTKTLSWKRVSGLPNLSNAGYRVGRRIIQVFPGQGDQVLLLQMTREYLSRESFELYCWWVPIYQDNEGYFAIFNPANKHVPAFNR